MRADEDDRGWASLAQFSGLDFVAGFFSWGCFWGVDTMTTFSWPLLSWQSTLLLAICGLAAGPVFGQERSSDEAPKATVDRRNIHVTLTDSSSLKVLLVDEQIELTTPHGTLQFPIADIQRIEFAPRVPADLALAIEKDITDLGSADFKVREAAMASLLERKERSYASLLHALREHTDSEMRQRINHLLDKLREALPEDQRQPRLHDYVHTAESRIAGKLSAASLRISSAQFGLLQLKLCDVREIRTQGAIASSGDEIDLKTVQDDPGTMRGREGDIGKSFAYRVTGSISGSCYGTDVYTTDTSLAMAAVHTGSLKTGETGIVIVTVLPSPASFISSQRNGVTSSMWGVYPAAYSIRRAKIAEPR